MSIAETTTAWPMDKTDSIPFGEAQSPRTPDYICGHGWKKSLCPTCSPVKRSPKKAKRNAV